MTLLCGRPCLSKTVCFSLGRALLTQRGSLVVLSPHRSLRFLVEVRFLVAALALGLDSPHRLVRFLVEVLSLVAAFSCLLPLWYRQLLEQVRLQQGVQQ